MNLVTQSDDEQITEFREEPIAQIFWPMFEAYTIP